MASVKELVAQICKDPLLLHGIETKCSKILKEVKIPAGWTETYKLENCNPSYKFRVKLMKDFVDVKKSESYTIINNNKQEFTEDLTGFLFEKESHCSDNDLHLPNESSYPDLFEKNWKIEGVVVRKSASRACVLVKSARPRGSPKQEEMILSYNAQQFPGLGIGLKVGDILCVAYNKRKGQQVLEPEVVGYR